MASKGPYTYRPFSLLTEDRCWLRDKVSQIRLLTLLSSEDTGALISCVMRQETVSQEMDQTSFFAGSGSRKKGEGKQFPQPPVYEILSYVWGNPKVKTTIVVCDADNKGHKGQLQVTVNLHVPLRHLRLTNRPRALWADAVRINQSNLDERARQVMIMGRNICTCEKGGCVARRSISREGVAWRPVVKYLMTLPRKDNQFRCASNIP